jgi:hypothetical protein
MSDFILNPEGLYLITKVGSWQKAVGKGKK